MARGPRSALKIPGGENTRMRTSPIPVPKTRRALPMRGLTTIPAGWITPVVAFGLMREDALTSCRLNFGLELYETVDVLANPVVVNARAYLVPNLAFGRFNGSIDTLNRAYMGEVEPGAGGTVVPWFTTSTVAPGPMGASNNEILFYLGSHVANAGSYNFAYNEAYNIICEHRYINRSPDLKPLAPLATNMKLKPAMWRHPDLGHIVPDFDQATLDGEVPLNIVDGRMPVKGLGLVGTAQSTLSSSYRTTLGNQASLPGWNVEGTGAGALTAGETLLYIAQKTGSPGYPDIWTDFAPDGATVSLSGINTAERARAFAALRKSYAGYDDEYIKDLLMAGVRMPTEAEKQPILLGNVVTQFGQGKRFATDSVDLTASVASGAASFSMNLRCPPVNTGGVVMVTIEIYPQQLWERREDTFLSGMVMAGAGSTGAEQFPEFVRDTLDPEKVDIVKCGRVDVRHATPAATFGYEPLNARWQTFPPRVGGKFYRPAVDLPADEDRARIWASETANPTLSKDFYLVTNLNLKPFVVTDQDPAEVLVRGDAMITGNTVFGLPLIESGDEYDTVMDQADMDRIDKVPVAGVTVAEEPEKEESK